MRAFPICCLLGLLPLTSAAEGISLGTERDRDRMELPQPTWSPAASAISAATGSESVIVYVLVTGNPALDGFWTSGAIEASARQPVVQLTGGLQLPEAQRWQITELPAVVLVDPHGNAWQRLQGKAVKPAAVEELVLMASGMLKRIRSQIAEGIAQAVEQSGNERKLPGAIATLTRYAALQGLPEAQQAQQALDRIVASGLAELQQLAALMQSDPAAARRQLPRFERIYAQTPLLGQAQRVRDGLPIDLQAPAPATLDASVAEEASQGVDLLGGP